MAFKLSGGVSHTVSVVKKNEWNWRLTVTYTDTDGTTKTTTVGYPLTIDFSIERNTFASANTATFSIYNLAPSTRDSEAFFQDEFFTDKVKLVTFKAGRNGKITTCFEGYIRKSYSKRNGTNVITEMHCLDLGTSKQTYINMTFEAGTLKKEAYSLIIKNCPELAQGDTGTIEGEFKTAVTLTGSPLEVLNQITDGHTFIDKGVVHTLQNNESRKVSVTILKGETGLIGTPQRQGAGLTLPSIFNPELEVGQLLEIDDPIQTKFNGTYMVTGFRHNGTISGAVAGSRTTQIDVLIGDYLNNSSFNITQTTDLQPFTAVEGKNVEVVNGQLVGSAYGIWQYIRKNNGKIPNAKITPQISWYEMIGHDNNDNERYNELTVGIISNCITIAQKLQLYINANTPGQKIIISSGWRSKRVNAKYSNASRESAHLRGCAIDFKYANINTLNVFRTKYNITWDKFTYLFRGNISGSPIIHVQSTLGKNDNRRSKSSIV